MKLTTTEKIRILIARKGLTITDLASIIGTTRQNLTNKLSRNNFNEQDLNVIASALNCSVEVLFTDNDTNITL